MAEAPSSISGNQTPLPSEDERAYQFYLESIGLGNPDNLDPDYVDSLREMTATRTTGPINELAAELPESQAETETTQLKLAISPTEGKIATEITSRIDRADKTHHGSPARAVSNTYQAVIHQLRDANNDLLNLHTVLVSPERGDPYVSAALIRENPAAIEMMAKYIRVIINTQKNFWPQYNQPEFTEQRMFARGMAIDIARSAQDASIERFVGSIYKLAENRFRFWSRGKGIAEAAKPVRGKVLSDPKQTFGTLLPQRWEEPPTEEAEPPTEEKEESPFVIPESARYTASERLEMQEESDEADELVSSSEPPADSAEPLEGLPTKEEIMTEYQERVEARAAYKQQLIDRNWPPGRAEQEAERRFPIETPEKAEARSKADDAKARHKARQQVGAKKRRSRPIKPSERRKPGYDHQRDPSNPWPF